MNASPLFSIIIPTYNRAHLIRKGIQSLLEQACRDWELIIIDDGSTDSTQEVVEAFEDYRIHYVYQEHQERSVARNRGIAMARGQYLCFLDDDDYFLSQHLFLLQKAILEQGKAIGVFRTGMLIERKGQHQKTANFRAAQGVHPVLFFLKNMAGMHSLCFHRDILAQLQFDRRWFHFQDTHLLIRALLDFPFFQVDAYTCVYVHYDRMGSLEAFRGMEAEQRTANNVAAIRDLFARGGEKLQALVPTHLEQYLVSRKYLDHAGGALRVGRTALSWKYFRQSVRHNSKAWLIKEYLFFLIRWLLAYLGFSKRSL